LLWESGFDISSRSYKIIATLMSRTVQHLVPIGFITISLFYLAKRSMEGFFDYLSPERVTTMALVGYLIFTLCASASLSLGLCPLAQVIEDAWQERRGVAKVLLIAAPFIIVLVIGVLLKVLLNDDVDLWVVGFFGAILLALPFFVSLVFGVYWVILLFEHLMVYAVRILSRLL
jgi:hypothetical protein